MLRFLLAAAALCLLPVSALAHPVPYSYLDLRIRPHVLGLSIVVHIFDVAHEIGVEPMESLLDPAIAKANSARIATLFAPRFVLTVDGRTVVGKWSEAEVLPDRQSMRFQVTYELADDAGLVGVHAAAFPYDPEHRTYLNVYEGDALAAQEILDRGRTDVEHFTGSRQGVRAIFSRFLPSGIHHILIGPDHILFLVGLLLTGGSVRRLLVMVTAFTVAHSVTLSLAALNIFTPPVWLIEPAIALSIVYVGIDNLARGEGRDVRTWIAFGFGFIHGFGFANVLRDMELPARALGWTLLSFNVGVEMGQIAIVVAVAAAIYLLRSKSEVFAARLAVVGSVAVIAAGAYWFIQRVFMPG